MQSRILLAAVAASLACAGLVRSADWPCWRGTDRENVWNETGILDRFPATGPEVLWRTTIAGGYAGPAVAQGRVYVSDYISADDTGNTELQRRGFTGTERILCLDERTGVILWQHEYPVQYSISYPAGPRCTATVDGNRLYSLGAEGHLFCLDTRTGDVRWSTHLPSAYHTKTAVWGYAAHPLIDGVRLITIAGGEGSHTVALHKLTGQEIWRSGTSSKPGYSPPTIIEFAKQRQLIVFSPDDVRSLEPQSGTEFWSVPFEASNGSTIMSPMRCGDYLYAASFSRRSLLLKLTNHGRPGVEEIWRDRRSDAISPVNVQPFYHEGVLYGLDQSGELAALELPSGNRLWSTPHPLADRRLNSGTAFIVRQANRYWMFTEHGELIIAELNRDGFHELDRARVIEPSNVAFGRDVVWSMPAFANRHAYIRNDHEIICVDLSE